MKGTIALLLAACLLASACEQGVPPPAPDPADPNGEITTSLAAEPDTIDPQRASFAAEIAQVAMVYEPLLTFDPKSLRPVAAAARALPDVSADGLTVTFTLRDGLVYSDGTPLRAADFMYGWKRLCDPSVAVVYAFAAYIVAGCEAWNNMDTRKASAEELAAAGARLGVAAPDATHVVFTLTRPAPYFLAIAALWVGAPVRESDVIAGGARWTEPATFIGNGPFKLTSWQHNERLVFERNDRNRAPAKLKRWTKLIIRDPAVVEAAFRNGELDVAPATGPRADGAVAVPNGCSFYIGFNTVRPPFDDPAVRLAFAKALDREAYVRDVLDTGGRPSLSLIPPGVPGFDPDDATQAFDPSGARALLSQSRYTAMPPLTFAYRASARTKALVRWAIAQWRANLGLTVVEEPISPGGFDLIVRGGQSLPMLFWIGWCQDYPDPQDWLTTIFRSGSSVTRTGYSSQEFDALVARADVEREPERRLELYRAAQRVLTREAPVAFVYSSETRWLVSPRLRGYVLTAADHEFGELTIATLYIARPGF